jgi:pimeloyl-ACP methyl ester carboxylesterase
VSESAICRLTVPDGTQLAYQRQGTGPTVVLVHGGFLDHRAWAGLAAVLAASGHTVIAPDRRGHGFSDPYGSEHSVAADASDLVEIIASVTQPGEKVRIVAHSSGGHSAIAAVNLSEAVSDLILYEPPQRRDKPSISAETWQQLHEAQAGNDRKRLVTIALVDVVGNATGQAPPVPFPEPFWQAPFAQLLLANALSIPTELKANSEQDDSDDSLRHIDVPTWCVIGGNSPTYNRSFSERLVTLNPSAQLIELPGQDHGAPMTDPVLLADLLNSLTAA